MTRAGYLHGLLSSPWVWGCEWYTEAGRAPFIKTFQVPLPPLTPWLSEYCWASSKGPCHTSAGGDASLDLSAQWQQATEN